MRRVVAVTAVEVAAAAMEVVVMAREAKEVAREEAWVVAGAVVVETVGGRAAEKAVDVRAVAQVEVEHAVTVMLVE